ncbi:MAG: ABC transporter transmembrane domain-containing protein [Candidatus Protistobacter heckmanni]|nr:ABC transporter transmembrane domain-containing protein [Candidatus Protistobacter heckmanni]
MQFESTRESLVTSLGKLYHHISSRRRSQFRLLLALSLVCSVAEIFSLGSIVPFVGIFTQPDLLLVKPIMKEVLGVLDIHSTDAAMLAITIAFIGATLISGALRLLLLWVTTQLGNAAGTDIGIEVFRRTLHQPFEVHIARNSSDIIANITQKVGITSSLLLSIVNLISSIILFLVILCVLLVIDPVVTVLTALFFGACYGLIIRVSRKRMRINGELISEELPKVQKSLQEGLGAILDVLLDGTQARFIVKSTAGPHRSCGWSLAKMCLSARGRASSWRHWASS